MRAEFIHCPHSCVLSSFLSEQTSFLGIYMIVKDLKVNNQSLNVAVKSGEGCRMQQWMQIFQFQAMLP